MMTHNYVGLADRTVMPVGGKPKARAKADWGWKPYKRSLSTVPGRIKVFRPNEAGILTKVRTLVPGPVKREARG